jgi:hypothetical protein
MEVIHTKQTVIYMKIKSFDSETVYRKTEKDSIEFLMEQYQRINPFVICEVCWVQVWCTYRHVNTRDQFLGTVV